MKRNVLTGHVCISGTDGWMTAKEGEIPTFALFELLPGVDGYEEIDTFVVSRVIKLKSSGVGLNWVERVSIFSPPLNPIRILRFPAVKRSPRAYT